MLGRRARGKRDDSWRSQPGTERRGVTIDIDNVTKVFPADKGGPVRALKAIDLSIRESEFVSVVGPSGCGKSTLMLIAAGLLSPSTGGVRVDGVALDKPLTDVGIAFQDALLLEHRRAMDNVLLQAIIRKLPVSELRERAEELFDRLGIAAAANRYPSQLSGGMRQRVSLVRTLVHRPAVLMMDEPFGALDALTRLQVRQDLERLWLMDKPTVLFITHSVEEAVGLSDRVVVMSPSPGEVVEEITVDLPRPRPVALGESAEVSGYANHIYRQFERMGVLRDGEAISTGGVNGRH